MSHGCSSSAALRPSAVYTLSETNSSPPRPSSLQIKTASSSESSTSKIRSFSSVTASCLRRTLVEQRPIQSNPGCCVGAQNKVQRLADIAVCARTGFSSIPVHVPNYSLSRGDYKPVARDAIVPIGSYASSAATATRSSSVSTPGPGRSDGWPTRIVRPNDNARSCSSCSQFSRSDACAAISRLSTRQRYA